MANNYTVNKGVLDYEILTYFGVYVIARPACYVIARLDRAIQRVVWSICFNK